MSRLSRSFILKQVKQEERVERLNTGKFRLADWAPQLLPEIGVSALSTLLITSIRTPEMLGHPAGATWSDIMASARMENLDFVPTALIPGIRLAYACQYRDDYIRIAHEPITGPGDRAFRFAMRDDGTFLWLHCRETGGDDAFWPADVQFMFMWGCEELTGSESSKEWISTSS